MSMGTAGASKDELIATIADLTRTIDRMTATTESQAQELGELRNELVDLRKELADLRKELADLRKELAKSRGESQTAPSVPSGQKPPYKKPSSKRKGRPGRKGGHVGVTRKKPETWDHEDTHTTKCCPHCDSRVRACRSSDGTLSHRERFIEDVVLEEPKTVRHKVVQYYCSGCKKRVEPIVTDAMPGDRIGLNVVVLSAVQHYLHGITLSRIVELLDHQHGFKITAGALVRAWQRLARHLQPEYDAIREAVVDQARVRHADETSWRVAGKTHWLWCFCTKQEVFYLIDKTRSSAVVKETLGEWLDGTLVTDFYASYNVCIPDHSQYCLAHVLRELAKIRTRMGDDPNEEYLGFERRLKRLLKEAIRFHAGNHDPPTRENARVRFEKRLRKITDPSYDDADSERLAKRLSNCHDGIFTFITEPGVDPTNNWAETNVRPAVIMRKNSYGNQSDIGAETQAILMSVFRTYNMQKRDVFESARIATQAQIVADHRKKNA